MLTNELPIYLAGLMDGEGSWSIQVNVRNQKGKKSIHFNPRMSMGLKFGTHTLELLKNYFGGSIYDYKDDGKKWYLGKRELTIEASEKLLPYLSIKKDVCERYLDAMYTYPIARTNRRSGGRDWTEDMCLKVAEIALTLNPASRNKIGKKLDYLNEIRKMYNE